MLKRKDALMLCRMFENLEDVSIETHSHLEEMLNESFDEFVWYFEPVNGTWDIEDRI